MHWFLSLSLSSTLPAPEIAVNYWKLSEKALMRDVILAIRYFSIFVITKKCSNIKHQTSGCKTKILLVRADEAHHRVVNHTLGDLNLNKQNPFGPGE